MRRERPFQPCVYILCNRRHGALYTGVTSDLFKRLWEHRTHADAKSHTSKYGIHQLVWFEQHSTMENAILRETRIKKWERAWRVRLIEENNPDWRDLGVDIGMPPLVG